MLCHSSKSPYSTPPISRDSFHCKVKFTSQRKGAKAYRSYHQTNGKIRWKEIPKTLQTTNGTLYKYHIKNILCTRKVRWTKVSPARRSQVLTSSSNSLQHNHPPEICPDCGNPWNCHSNFNSVSLSQHSINSFIKHLQELQNLTA